MAGDLKTKGEVGFFRVRTGTNGGTGVALKPKYDFPWCMKRRSYAFLSVGNTDTWASGIKGITRVAVEASTDNNVMAAFSGSTVTFSADGASPCILHVWSNR